MELDPLALYGAVVSTFVFGIQIFREVRDRPRLSAEVTTSWPEFAPDKYSDLGGDPGPMYVRLEITNIGRRPITLRSAGLTTRMVEGPVLGAKVPRGLDRFQVPLTARPTDESKTLPEGASWVLERTADDVAWDVGVEPVGHMVVSGVFAETSTGKTHFWPAKKAIRDGEVLKLGQPPWQPPAHDLDNPPAYDPAADHSHQ